MPLSVFNGLLYGGDMAPDVKQDVVRVVPFDDLLRVAHLPADGVWPLAHATRIDWVYSMRGWWPRPHPKQPTGETRCGLSLTERPWIEWPDTDLPLCQACSGVEDEQEMLL